MKLTPTTQSEIPAIMDIIADAQKYLAELNIDQWQDGYPTQEQIELDITNEDSYVVVNDDDKVMGTSVFTTKSEPTYKEVDEGWLTPDDAKYGVIHRLAVSDQFRGAGVGKFVFTTCEEQLIELNIKSMRIDTHRDNKGMQHMLKKRGYEYCGVIYLDSGAERLAYEKILID